jgi:hypothetical protein
MSTDALAHTLTQLQHALTHAPDQVDAANRALRAQLDRLRQRPTSLTADQLGQARGQLQTLAELARLHAARRLQGALRAEVPTAYGRHGQLR